MSEDKGCKGMGADHVCGKINTLAELKPCTRVTYFRLVNYTEKNIATRLNTAFQILLAQAQPADGTRGTRPLQLKRSCGTVQHFPRHPNWIRGGGKENWGMDETG